MRLTPNIINSSCWWELLRGNQFLRRPKNSSSVVFCSLSPSLNILSGRYKLTQALTFELLLIPSGWRSRNRTYEGEETSTWKHLSKERSVPPPELPTYWHRIQRLAAMPIGWGKVHSNYYNITIQWNSRIRRDASEGEGRTAKGNDSGMQNVY